MGWLFAGARGGVVGRSVFAMVGGVLRKVMVYVDQIFSAMRRSGYTSTSSTLSLQYRVSPPRCLDL
jgi:hypothetical protein